MNVVDCISIPFYLLLVVKNLYATWNPKPLESSAVAPHVSADFERVCCCCCFSSFSCYVERSKHLSTISFSRSQFGRKIFSKGRNLTFLNFHRNEPRRWIIWQYRSTMIMSPGKNTRVAFVQRFYAPIHSPRCTLYLAH